MANNQSYKKKLDELRKKRLRSFITSLILISFVATLAAVGSIWLDMKNVFIFGFLGLLPGLLSIIWDKKPGRFASKTVFAFNLTGIFPYLMAITHSGSPDNTAYYIMNEPIAWLLVYGFAIFGWSIILVIPKMTLIFLEMKSKYLVNKMQNFQEELISEWGERIKDGR